MDENEISGRVIGAAIEVHKAIGPGLLEGVYRKCLAYELEQAGLRVRSEVPLPLRYKDMEFKDAYRIDLLVEDVLIVELKAVDILLPVFTAQLLSYLKMSRLRFGLLVNFNVPYLKDGIKRVANNF